MKKRALSLLLASIILIGSYVIPSNAADRIFGEALYTEIVAYIDGYPIRSYNVNNNTYIMVEDLSAYGFAVTWDGTSARLIISTERTAKPDQYTSTFVPEEIPSHLYGKHRADIYVTSVTTWIDDKQITGYNIGGYTLIWFDDLATHTGSLLEWVPAEKALRMTSVEPVDMGTPLKDLVQVDRRWYRYYWPVWYWETASKDQFSHNQTATDIFDQEFRNASLVTLDPKFGSEQAAKAMRYDVSKYSTFTGELAVASVSKGYTGRREFVVRGLDANDKWQDIFVWKPTTYQRPEKFGIDISQYQIIEICYQTLNSDGELRTGDAKTGLIFNDFRFFK